MPWFLEWFSFGISVESWAGFHKDEDDSIQSHPRADFCGDINHAVWTTAWWALSGSKEIFLRVGNAFYRVNTSFLVCARASWACLKSLWEDIRNIRKYFWFSHVLVNHLLFLMFSGRNTGMLLLDPRIPTFGLFWKRFHKRTDFLTSELKWV